MNETRVVIDEQAVLNAVAADVKIVFGIIGRIISEQARASMQAHDQQIVNGRVQYVGKTPKGQPPRVRSGVLANNIGISQGVNEVSIGPIALAGHDTECLARLEFVDHPFMGPALKASLPRLPQVWANSISR